MSIGFYPGISERIKAILADSVVMIVLMYLVSSIFSSFETVPDNWRIVAFVFIFLAYDPLFTSLFGGTIGHMLLGIRVKRESDESRNILFPFAVIRFIIKASLGIISLFTVSTNEKRRAIHDMVAGSIVVYK